MNKKKLLLISVICISVWSYGQNQFNVSQYMLHHTFINPAAAGNSNALNGAMFYRNQWTGMSGAPATMGINLNKPLGSGKATVGGTIMHDKIGVNKNFEFSGLFAYRLKVGLNKYLNFGLSATVSMIQSNLAGVETIQENDPVFSANTPTFTMPNSKFGIYYFTPKFYVGFAIPNLLENKIVYDNAYKGKTSFNPENLHYYLQAGYSIALSDKWDLNPSTLIKQVSGAPMQIDLNAQVVYNKKVGGGFSFRTSKELIGLINFQITPMFKLAYAYDFNWGQLGSYSRGSHEIMLIFQHLQLSSRPVIETPRF